MGHLKMGDFSPSMEGECMKKVILQIIIYAMILYSMISYLVSNRESKEKDTTGQSYATEELLVYPDLNQLSANETQRAEPDASQEPTGTTTPKPTKKPQKEKLPPDLDIPLDYDIQKYIYKQCGYDADLYCFIMAMIEQESGFNEKEISSTNDYGLMQINGCNHDDLNNKYGKQNFLDPYDNVYCGIKIIKGYMKEFEHKNLALMAYNMGKGGARRLWRQGIYSSRYSDSVMEKYRKYLQQSEKEM